MSKKLLTIFQHPWFPGIILMILTCVLYSGTIHYGILFNYDDDAYFSDPTISDFSVAIIPEFFRNFYLGMYQPIPALTFALTDLLFPDSVVAQRILNIILHLVNSLLVFCLLERITKSKTVGWLTAFVFAIHPMHVESVTWISTRSNLVYSLFYLLALLYYTRWRQEGSKRLPILILLFFLLSLFSKVTAATLPAIILLADIILFKETIRKSILLYVTFLLLSGAFIWIGVNASGSFGHITDLGENYSIFDRFFLILNALWLYLSKAFVPFSQSVIYLYPWKEGSHLPMSYLLQGVMILMVLATMAYFGWNRRKYQNMSGLVFGLLFFLVTISIVLPLKWSRTILIAERYTYIPYIGLFGGLFYSLRGYMDSVASRFRTAIVILLAFILGCFSYLSYERNRVWENPITLFSDVIKHGRSGAEVSMGYYNRGNEYLRTGQLEMAIGDYTKAISIFSLYREAYFNRGLAYNNSGNYEAAITDYSEVIRMDNCWQQAFVNRGIAYRSLGMDSRALDDFNEAISRVPDGLAFFNRGALYYFNFSDTLSACRDWQKAKEAGFAGADEVLLKYCK